MHIYLYLINVFNSSKNYLKILLENNYELISEKNIKLDQQNKSTFMYFRRSWREYLNIDNVSFSDDINEMYNKYNCQNYSYYSDNVKCISDFYIHEDINSNLDIYDINEIFTHSSTNIKIKLIKKDIRDIVHNYKFSENHYVFSTNFKNIIKIIENDLVNITKYFCQNIYKKIDLYDYAKSRLSQSKSTYKKIFSILKLCYKILETNFSIKKHLTSSKKDYLYQILRKTRDNKNINHNLRCKFFIKIRKLCNLICKNNKYKSEIFEYTISLFNSIEDDKIKAFIVYGMQNLFLCDLYNDMPRFYNVLILLYAMRYEKSKFSINWIEKFYRILTNSKHKLPELIKNFLKEKKMEEMFENIFKKKLYVLMNILYQDYFSFLSHRMDENNMESHLLTKLIYYVSLVKCKLFGLEINLKLL